MEKNINDEIINKSNSSKPFEILKSIEKKKSGLQANTERNTSDILRHNKNTTLKCNTHRNELLYNNGHFSDLVQDILRKQMVG